MDRQYLVKKIQTSIDPNANNETKTYYVTKPDFSRDLSQTYKKIEIADNDSFLKFDKEGYLQPTSVLGSIDDFIKTIEEKNAENENDQKTPQLMKRGVSYVDSAQEKRRLQNLEKSAENVSGNENDEEVNQAKGDVKIAFDQNSALLNWQKKMEERKRIHGRISKLVDRRPVTIHGTSRNFSDKSSEIPLMNTADHQRKINEIRMQVDRGIPSVDYGKGFRTGSEFWRQHENIGDDVTGLKMTLTKSERGLSSDFIEKIGKPTKVLNETTSQAFSRADSTRGSSKFFSNPYLQSRLKQLDRFNIIHGDEVIGNKNSVQFDDLLITGHNQDSLENLTQAAMESNQKLFQNMPQTAPVCQKSSTPANKEANNNNNFGTAGNNFLKENSTLEANQKFVGPILSINGKIARYNDRHDLEERVLLQSESNGKITKSELKLENLGSTRISFHFRRVLNKHNSDQNEVSNSSIDLGPPRFFFNRLGGCILPGETLYFPFHFKSTKPGIFSESWILNTEPNLLNSCQISIRLYAIAIDVDAMHEKRIAVKKKLLETESHTAAQSQLTNMLDQVFTIADAKTKLIDYSFAKNNTETRFDFNNAGWKGRVELSYRHDLVQKLEGIWKKCYGYKSRPATVDSQATNTQNNEADVSISTINNSLDIPPWNFDILELKNLVIETFEDSEEIAEKLLLEINDHVNELRHNFVGQDKRFKLLLVDGFTEKKNEATILWKDMLTKFLDAAEIVKDKKADDNKSESSRASSGKDKKQNDRASRESQRNAQKEKEKDKKENNQNQPELADISENPEEAAAILQNMKEEQLAKLNNYKQKLHSVCDGIFAQFVEGMLDNFDELNED